MTKYLKTKDGSIEDLAKQMQNKCNKAKICKRNANKLQTHAKHMQTLRSAKKLQKLINAK